SASRLVLRLLLRQLGTLRRYLRATERARLVVVVAFGLLFAAVMRAEYTVFRRALEALAALQHAGPPLTLYFLESFLVLILIVLFGLLAGGAAAVLTTAAAAAFRHARTRVGIAAAVCVLLAAFAIVVARNVIPSTSDFYAIFEPGILDGKPSSIKFIEAKFGLWPSHPFAAELYAVATGGRAGSAVSRTLLWLTPFASLALAATLGRRLYARPLPA